MSRLFVATRKGLFRLDESDDGKGWVVAPPSFLGDPVTMVLPDARDGTVYAAVGHGQFGVKLHRSRDGGDSWESCVAPAYPPKPEGVEDREPMRGSPIPWNVEQIWALESGGAELPGVLWCGTIPGGLFRSPDRGDSWELNLPLWNEPRRKEWFGGGYDYPGIHSICVDPRDSRHVTVAISCGGVWVTTDAGESWTCRAEGMFAAYMPPEQQHNPAIQDPHRMVQCAGEPDVLWCQHHNAVFRSTDGAMSWTEVKRTKPSKFGFAVAVHPHRPEVAWLAPAVSDERRVPVDGKVVVSRTLDGGKTWKVRRRGLPQKGAYDLIYRHCLDVDASGDRLAMGSTTGSLWVSGDQGDSWKAVSVHLPPVFAVRFAD